MDTIYTDSNVDKRKPIGKCSPMTGSHRTIVGNRPNINGGANNKLLTLRSLWRGNKMMILNWKMFFEHPSSLHRRIGAILCSPIRPRFSPPPQSRCLTFPFNILNQEKLVRKVYFVLFIPSVVNYKQIEWKQASICVLKSCAQ